MKECTSEVKKLEVLRKHWRMIKKSVYTKTDTQPDDKQDEELDERKETRAALLLVDKVMEVGGEYADRFWRQNDKLALFCAEVDARRTWASGCPCHESERKAGRNFNCKVAGYRLAEAYEYLRNTISCFRSWPESFTLDDYAGDAGLLVQFSEVYVSTAVWFEQDFDFIFIQSVRSFRRAWD